MKSLRCGSDMPRKGGGRKDENYATARRKSQFRVLQGKNASLIGADLGVSGRCGSFSKGRSKGKKRPRRITDGARRHGGVAMDDGLVVGEEREIP